MNFIKGSKVIVLELVQIKRNLGKTQYTEAIKRQYKIYKNRSIQIGGILKVFNGRDIVLKRADNNIRTTYKKVDKAN